MLRSAAMMFPGRRTTSDDAASRAKANRPLRGGPIPVCEADLPFYAALVGRPTTAEDRTAVFLAEFAAAGEQLGAWGKIAARVKQLVAFRRAG